MKKSLLAWTVFLAVLLAIALAYGGIEGDIDCSGKVDLKDAVYGLQVVAGFDREPPACIDYSVGLTEVVHALQVMVRFNAAPSVTVLPDDESFFNNGKALARQLFKATDPENDVLQYVVGKTGGSGWYLDGIAVSPTRVLTQNEFDRLEYINRIRVFAAHRRQNSC